MIGAGFCRDIDLARFAPELRRIDATLNLELLERIHRRHHDVEVEVDISVRHAVERVIIHGASHPRDRDVLIDAIPALASAGNGRRGESIGYIGTQRDQLQKIAAIQG